MLAKTWNRQQDSILFHVEKKSDQSIVRLRDQNQKD